MRSPLGDRIGIGVAGAVLLWAGGYGLWALRARPDLKVFDLEYLAGNPWARSIGGALVALLAMVATRWLVLSLGWRRRGSRDGTGTAMLGVALQSVDGVDRLQVRVVGGRRTEITVRCRPGAPLGELARLLDRQAVSRVRGVLGPHSALPVLVRLHVRRR